MKRVALALLVACTHTPTRTPMPDVTVNDLSASLETIRSRGKLPALAAAAWRGRDLLAIGAAGARKEGGTPITVEDRFHLGSDTKAMTAVLVAIWIDRGKLHWDDTLRALFGEGVHESLAGVTLEQLLQQRGGFAGALPPEELIELWKEGDDSAARDRWVMKQLAKPAARPPGTFEYSNTSYVVLGAALARATGKSWEDLMRADLFAPLDMRSCGFGAPDGDSPWGHRDVSGERVAVAPGPLADNAPILGPAGRVHCSLRDWGKFLGVVLAGARGEATLAGVATMKRLLTPPPGAAEHERYAGGWMMTTRPWGGVVYTHSGSNTMWTATAWLAPEKNLAFAAATNVFAPKELDAAFSTTIPVYAK